MKQGRRNKLGSQYEGSQQNPSLKNASGILSFANQLAGKGRQSPGAHTLTFLKFVLDKKLAQGNLPSFGGSLIFKESGRALRQSFYTWIVQSVLSLTVNKLEQNFRIWLKQSYTAHTLSNIINRIHFASPSRLQSAGRSMFLNQPGRDSSDSPALSEIPHIVVKWLQTASITNRHIDSSVLGRWIGAPTPTGGRPHSLSRNLHADLLMSPPSALRETLYTTRRSLPAIYAKVIGNRDLEVFQLPSLRAIQALLASYVRLRAEEIKYETGSPISNFLASAPPVFVNLQQNVASKEPDSPPLHYTLGEKHREMLEKIKEVSFSNVLNNSRADYRPSYVYGRATGVAQAKFVTRPPGITLAAPIHQISPPPYLRPSQLNQRPGESAQRSPKYRDLVPGRSVGSVAIKNRFEQKWEAGPFLTSNKTFSVGVVASQWSRDLAARIAQTFKPIIRDQEEDVNHRFTFLRREEPMRPPPQSFAYAHPTRQTVEEEQEINWVREKKVVEIVRSEVETLMKSSPAITELSRLDYSKITDQVWFSLSRRLMMERERLGHRH